MKKELIHSSTNSHYIEGAESVITELSYSVPETQLAKLTHAEHDTLPILPSKNVNVSFLATHDYITGLIERVKD